MNKSIIIKGVPRQCRMLHIGTKVLKSDVLYNGVPVYDYWIGKK